MRRLRNDNERDSPWPIHPTDDMACDDPELFAGRTLVKFFLCSLSLTGNPALTCFCDLR